MGKLLRQDFFAWRVSWPRKSRLGMAAGLGFMTFAVSAPAGTTKDIVVPPAPSATVTMPPPAVYDVDGRDRTIASFKFAPLPSEPNSDIDQWKLAREDRAIYRKNLDELENALADCALSRPCPAYLKRYEDMIAYVLALPSPAMQIEAINSWVNLAIRYDDKEHKEDLPHRTMVGALRDGSGVCDEQAQLKLAAIEIMGLAVNARYQRELWVENGIFTDYHAVVTVRIGGTVWVMNNQQDRSSPRHGMAVISSHDAEKVFFEDSSVEAYVTHLNFAGESAIGDKSAVHYPYGSFMRTEAFVDPGVRQPGDRGSPYASDAPPGALAVDDTTCISLATGDMTGHNGEILSHLMRSALAYHFRISNKATAASIAISASTPLRPARISVTFPTAGAGD